MGPFRVLQISIVVLMLFGSTWLVRTIGLAASPSGSSSTWLSSKDVLAGTLQQGDNGENDNGDADNGDADNDDADNGDADNGDADNDDGDNGDDNDNDDGDDDDDDDDDDFDDNDNFDDFDFPDLSRPSSSEPARRAEPQCSTPGQETVFTSDDEKVTVRVFGSSRPVRVEIYKVIDFLSAPLPPGNLVGLLAYELRASYCDTNPLTQFPSEVNLGIRYSDIEATGLDENRFVIGHLDMATGTWSAIEKRGNDPAGNFTSATIIDTGFYMVWEAR